MCLTYVGGGLRGSLFLDCMFWCYKLRLRMGGWMVVLEDWLCGVADFARQDTLDY